MASDRFRLKSFDGIIVEVRAARCRHCGADVDMVNLLGVVEICTEQLAHFPTGRGKYRWAHIVHLCDDPAQRRGAMKDLVRCLPRA